eukprot:symbB.v1.2.040009.t1/scaffold6927.1/size14497/3
MQHPCYMLNIEVTESEASKKKQKLGASSQLPALEALAGVFASPEYRELIQEVTNCGELCERVDLATQASLHDA